MHREVTTSITVEEVIKCLVSKKDNGFLICETIKYNKINKCVIYLILYFHIFNKN